MRSARVLIVTLLVSASSVPALTQSTGFSREMDRAMVRMMTGMHRSSSGDIDKDFAAMMIPHHQGAIDMAIAELKYGHNEQLKRIAQEIIIEQQHEIIAMHLAVADALQPPARALTQPEER